MSDYNLDIVEYKGKNGYWVKMHHLLKVTNYLRHNITEAIKDKKEIRKVFIKKDSAKNVEFFITIDTPPYLPLEAEIFGAKNNLKEEVHDGMNGYWLTTQQYATLLKVSVSFVRTIYKDNNEDNFPQETVFEKISERKQRFFVCTDREPYTSEDAKIFRLEFLLRGMEINKADAKDIVRWKELQSLNIFLKNNPNVLSLLSMMSNEKEETIEATFEMGQKIKNLFE